MKRKESVHIYCCLSMSTAWMSCHLYYYCGYMLTARQQTATNHEPVRNQPGTKKVYIRIYIYDVCQGYMPQPNYSKAVKRCVFSHVLYYFCFLKH